GNGYYEFSSSHRRVTFSGIEDLNIPPSIVAVGAASDSGRGKPLVKVFEAGTNDLLYSFYAYTTKFKGGVRVATGDLNGDNVPDVGVAPGAGLGGIVKVSDGATLATLTDFEGNISNPCPALLDHVFPDGESYRNGLSVAVGDVNGDGTNDIV